MAATIKTIPVVILFMLFMITAAPLAAQTCATVPEGAATDEQKQKLQQAYSAYRFNNDNADNIIGYGRHLAYAGNFAQAIDIFNDGVEKFPGDARMYRHRGQQFLVVRCFDKAITDLTRAAKIMRKKADVLEPAGIPGALDIVPGTIKTNIYYHLGLAYFFRKNMPAAEEAFNNALKLSKYNDMKIAAASWLNVVLQSQGKKEQADDLWNSLSKESGPVEVEDYRTLLALYHVDKPATPQEVDEYLQNLLPEKKSRLSSATLLFGVGYYCHLNNLPEKAGELFEKLKQDGSWGSWGFIAAENL